MRAECKFPEFRGSRDYSSFESIYVARLKLSRIEGADFDYQGAILAVNPHRENRSRSVFLAKPPLITTLREKMGRTAGWIFGATNEEIERGKAGR